jgi:hypothetical protein
MDKLLTKQAQASVFEFQRGWNELSLFESDNIITYEDYKKTVQECRFFYRHDAIVSTVINKLVEIGITDIELDFSSIPQNEQRIYLAYLDKIYEFIKQCAMEYLITGLVVPEIYFEDVDREELQERGIKKYQVLKLPTSLWVRNSEHIKINNSFFGDDKPSYFLKIPQELISFITSKGTYPDGTKDLERYKWLKENFPVFVANIEKGTTEILLDNKLVVRRSYLADSPYPIPYILPALDALKHKRNLRLMDYVIATRVIRAIQHVKVGNDEYPLLEGEEEIFDNIRAQLNYQSIYGNKLDKTSKIVQLFTNHTVDINWIIPDIDALLNSSKYDEINDDIFFALGFPRILTTGETLRSQTSNHELATKSPIKTMESMQKDLLPIVRYIFYQIKKLNNLSNYPAVRFKNLDFYRFADFVNGLFQLREQNGVSLDTLCRVFGLDYSDEQKKILNENQQ